MRTLDPQDYVWWLASRASGIVALVLITASVGLGLAMATKVVRAPGVRPMLGKVHEHTALAGLIAIAVHGITLLGDVWLNPGVRGLLVPFSMDYKPLFTGLGIIAGYLAAALGLSFYARRRIGAKLWRKAHRATVVVYALAIVHTLGAGTDAGSSWLRAFMLATGVPILVLLVVRLRPATKPAATATPKPARAPAPAHHERHREPRLRTAEEGVT
jgi:sulfoxide reductase heme-binding subunit YedZ